MMIVDIKRQNEKIPTVTNASECQPLLLAKNKVNDARDDDNDNDEEQSVAKMMTATTMKIIKTTMTEDAMDILKIGVPIFISRISWVGKKTTDTGLLGHLSKDALAAAALSDLWTMTSSVLLTGRILGVLIGGAIGAGNPKLAGIYLQISYLVIFSISIFVFLAWNCTERVWLAFGSDQDISKMAGYYARSLSFAIPGMIGFGQLSQFFSAQKIMYPEANASTFGLVANLAFGLIFVLGWPIKGFDGYGFTACPIVTVVTTYAQLAILVIVYIHFLKLHTPCWPGFKWSEITWARIKTFSELYFPAALSSASDFWRVAVIGKMAADLGDAEVAIFNTAYRIMWIALIFISALASASSVDMSIRLGKMDPQGARQVGYVGVGMSVVVLFGLCILILYQNRLFGMIFTSDEELLALFKECSIPFTITLFFMNLSVAIERIPYSMGRTKEVFWMGFVASWGGQVPAVLLLTKWWRNDLFGLYTGMAIGYAMLAVLYSVIVLRSYDTDIWAAVVIGSITHIWLKLDQSRRRKSKDSL